MFADFALALALLDEPKAAPVKARVVVTERSACDAGTCKCCTCCKDAPTPAPAPAKPAPVGQSPAWYDSGTFPGWQVFGTLRSDGWILPVVPEQWRLKAAPAPVVPPQPTYQWLGPRPNGGGGYADRIRCPGWECPR